jgi:hypothetical protein
MLLVELTENNLKVAKAVTTHVAIAKYARLNKISVRKLIDNYKDDLEKFGKLSFSNDKINRGRRT